LAAYQNASIEHTAGVEEAVLHWSGKSAKHGVFSCMFKIQHPKGVE